MDEGNLGRSNTAIDELLAKIVIDRERALQGEELVRRHVVERFLCFLVAVVRLLHQFAQPGLLGGLGLLRGRQVDEYKLDAALGFPLLVDAGHLVGGAMHLGAGIVAIARIDEAHVERSLARVRHDLEHVVGALLLLLGQVLGAPDDRALWEHEIAVVVRLADADVGGLIRRTLHGDVGGLAAAHLRERQRLADRGELRLDVVVGDDIGEAQIMLHQLGHVHELREAAVELVLSRRRQLPIRHHLAEHLRPSVKVRDAEITQHGLVEVAHDREHFGHGVAQRGTGEEHDVIAVGAFQDETALHEQIGGLLAACRVAEPRDALHRGGIGEVLELVHLVDIERIHAELVEGQPIVLFAGVEQPFHLGLEIVAPLRELGDVAAFLARGTTQRRDRVLKIVHLRLNEPCLILSIHADTAERRVRDNNRVPVSGGDASEQALAVLLLEILLSRRQDLGARVELDEIGAPLSHEVVGNHEHRLAGLSDASLFHRRCNGGKRLAGAHGMVGERGTALHRAPDEALLVRAQLDDVVAHLARKAQMRAVIAAQDIRVEGVVVDPDELVAAGVIVPQPLSPLRFDALGFLVGRVGGALVDHSLAVARAVGDRDALAVQNGA
ncbi:unknown [Sinorhizobium phage PBC5]|nr:unknown [Sinorhizobium phage PBC5]